MQTQCRTTQIDRQAELSALKSYFISMISHELRTPLTTILSSADLLECYNNSWSEEKKLQHLRQIQNAAVEMTQLLESEEFSQQLKACARQLK